MSRWPLGDGAELRILEPGDAEDLFAMVGRNRDRLGEYLPWVHTTQAVPDVAAFLGDRVKQIDRRTIPVPFAPDIAVEVLSPSETAVHVARKVREYLRRHC